MRYVLFNDTSHTNNPGCQGTVACLRTLLEARGMSCVRSHPVGFGEQRFSQPDSSIPATRYRLGQRLRCWRDRHWPMPLEPKIVAWNRPPLPFDRGMWKATARQLERDYEDFLSDVDAIVINGEGTIHHNLSGALALVAWASVAARRGVRVYVVNCTIQALDPFLLDALFTASTRIAVRESRTFNYLMQHGHISIQASDALFAWPKLALDDQVVPPVSDRRSCIYSPGVLAKDIAMRESLVGDQIQRLVEAGWKVRYLTVELEDERFEAAARGAGAMIYPIRRWTPTDLITTLREHDVVISGRYHLIIFAWLAGRPVVPMMSNTWKIEGLLEMAGLTSSSVLSQVPPPGANSSTGFLPNSGAIDHLRILAAKNMEACI